MSEQIYAFIKDGIVTNVSVFDNPSEELLSHFKNEFNLVVVAFKREQQAQVDTWINAITPILKEKPNLSFFEIPLIRNIVNSHLFGYCLCNLSCFHPIVL